MSTLIDFFNSNFKSGTVGLVGISGLLGTAIKEAQENITLDGSPSQWSHSFIFGDLRFDRHSPDSSIIQSPYIFESALKVSFLREQLKNGAQENWIGKWCDKEIDTACVIDFGLSEEERINVLATALELIDEQVNYPVAGLIAFWFEMIEHKLWKPNPLEGSHSMICSQFVRYCYRSAKRDFLGPEIDVSNTAPEHIYQAGLKLGKVTLWKNIQ